MTRLLPIILLLVFYSSTFAQDAIAPSEGAPFSRLADRLNRQAAEVESICKQQQELALRWRDTDNKLAEIGPLRRQLTDLTGRMTTVRDGFRSIKDDVQEVKSARRGIMDKLNKLQEGRAEVIDAKSKLTSAKAELKLAKAELAGARTWLIGVTALAGLALMSSIKAWL